MIVEDWVDYAALLRTPTSSSPNGGYGSIMQATAAGVPDVSGGWFEAKNDINARLAYRKLAVDPRTERPTPADPQGHRHRHRRPHLPDQHPAKVAAELRAATPSTPWSTRSADRL